MTAKALLIHPIPVVILIAVVGLSALSSRSEAPPSAVRADTTLAVPFTAQEPDVQVHGASPDLHTRLTEALDRFSTAGLTLPALDITFHDGLAGCEGHPGLFRTVEGVSDIEICNPTNHIMLHELAHSWVATHTTQGTKDAFIQYWGLATWNDQDAEWNDRANERSAEAIAFALGHVPAQVSPSLADYLCAYTLLTGESPAAEVECASG
jgi:predicted membrane-bound mannosyltransferase